MATYKEIVVPEVRMTTKIIPANFAFVGNELDFGQGNLTISTAGRIVDPVDHSPVLTPEGAMQYVGGGKPISTDISALLTEEFDGLSGAAVLTWLGKYFDKVQAVSNV